MSTKTVTRFSADHLAVLANRTVKIALVYSNSMDTEFWHSPDAVDDWKLHLRRLSNILEPTRYAIANKEPGDDVDLIIKELSKFSTRLLKGIKSLSYFDRSTDNSVKRILDTLREVQLGIADLSNVKLAESKMSFSELTSLCPAILAYPGNSNAITTLRLAKAQMARACSSFPKPRPKVDPFDIEGNKSDIEACMKSRGYYLAAHYCCFFYPDAWNEVEFNKYVELHDKALENMLKGTHFTESVQNRLLDVKENLNPKKLEKHRLAAA